MVFVCAVLIKKLKCETVPEGEIFPYLLGGGFTSPNYKISRLDTSYSLGQISGANNFKNVHGAPVEINVIEFDEFGNTYVGGDFHGHESSTKHEIQKIWTECRKCNYESQVISVRRKSKHFVVENITLTVIEGRCLNPMYIKTDLNVSSHAFYYNTTADDMRNILSSFSHIMEVLWVKKYIELSNATIHEYRYTWSILLKETRTCTDDRNIRMFTIDTDTHLSDCRISYNLNITDNKLFGKINVTFPKLFDDTRDASALVSWDSTALEFKESLNTNVGEDMFIVTKINEVGTLACGHSWNITFPKMKNYDDINVTFGGINATLLSNELDIATATLRHGSSISGDFRLSINSILSTSMEFNVSAQGMEQTILSTFPAFLDISVSRTSLREDNSFEWLVTFSKIDTNDTSGIVAGFNVAPILFDSSLFGGDGVYIASSEIQAGSFLSGIIKYRDGKWIGLGAGIEETDGHINAIYVDKMSGDIAIGGKFQYVIDIREKTYTFMKSGCELNITSIYNDSSTTKSLLNASTNTSMITTISTTTVKNVHNIVKRSSFGNWTSLNCSMANTDHVQTNHSFGVKMRANGFAVFLNATRTWKVISNARIHGTVKSLAFGVTSMVEIGSLNHL